MVRYQRDQREDVNALRNLDLTYRDMNMGGKIRQIPVSTFADIHYGRTYGSITRLNEKPVITISSNVLGGFNPNSIVAQVTAAIHNFNVPAGVDVELTGEQEDQKETGAFLGRAFMISIMLIFIILITLFNSLSKPFIILTEVVFCVVGIMLGYAITKMDISIVMSGIGFVALAGLVVRNGILLVEFTDMLLEQGYSVKDAVVEAGKIRMTPVILTAVATILGLIPLGMGLNIDFGTLLTDGNPHIYFGGDSVAFWGPLSWTMIFGLSFAVFLTLILVPIMYAATNRFSEASGEGHMFKNPFSFKGRIRRTEYGISFAILLVLLIIFNQLLGGVNPGALAQTTHMLFNILLLWFLIVQSIKRCHDMGKSGWWGLIPIWDLLLFFKPGTQGSNDYGENPRSLPEPVPVTV
jgi:multidrug efflux pump subunit AcrB/uncharacterized membrane protein YhaH (DUF805 family)